MTGPLAALMYSVLPSTLSRVPATRCVVGCCADAVETANTAARATAVMIRIVLMSVLPMGVTRGRAYTDRPEWRRRRRGGATLRAISGERILHGPPGNGSAALSTALSESGWGPLRRFAAMQRDARNRSRSGPLANAAGTAGLTPSRRPA